MENNNQILALIHEGRWEEVSRALIEEKTSLRNPSPSKIFLDTIVQLIQAGKKNEAFELIRVSLRVFQESPTLHNLEGLLYQIKESRGLAEKAYKQAIKLYPEYALAWNNLGTIYSEMDMLNDALICYKRAAKHDKKYVDALWNLANCLYMLREFDESLVTCKNLLTSDKKSNAYYLMGLISRERKDYGESIKLFQQAIELSTTRYDEAEFELATTLANTSQFREALSAFSSITDSRVLGSRAYVNIGLVLARIGKLSESLTNFEKALDLGEDSEEALNGYAVNLNDTGDHDRANSVFERALAKYPKGFTSNFNYGVHLHNRKMYKESQDFILKCLELDSADKGLKKIAHGYMLKNEYELKNYSNLQSELNTIHPDYVSAMSGFIAAKTKVRCDKDVTNAYCEDPLSYFRHQSLLDDTYFEADTLNNIRELFEVGEFDIKDQKLLHNGIQTAGNLLSYENSDIQKLGDLISRKLEEFKSEFHNSTDGVINYWPQQYMLHAWLLSINSGGKLDPHIHENSWISGSIYISVPKLDGDEGAIVVCESDEDSSFISRITRLKSYDICIFPASLCHHTLPFSSDDPRITLAFDVIPI